jgi:hypothetical protein
MIGSGKRNRIAVIGKHHAVMMICSITQLALFLYGLLAFADLMRIVFDKVLVGKYQCLPCRKANQNDPDIKYMATTLFQYLAKAAQQ